jgi:hypothetical protein
MTLKKIINNIEIELTSEEIAQRQIDEQQALLAQQEKDNKKAEDLANKQSAISKLKALGLNDAEINSILGK